MAARLRDSAWKCVGSCRPGGFFVYSVENDIGISKAVVHKMRSAQAPFGTGAIMKKFI